MASNKREIFFWQKKIDIHFDKKWPAEKHFWAEKAEMIYLGTLGPIEHDYKQFKSSFP